ncbi:uncharacterized protein BDV14DRAFT_171876 [Aspergillus stella-maris]|uniref:uncharacterized protein n=1 Tax=Aspergillus stella-maris TaxID=1810926 RepID=UPI003CCCAA10
MAQQGNKVPGNNDAVYANVPKEDQLFKVEFLEVAPTPIPTDRLFFIYLRGFIPESKRTELGLANGALTDATFEIRASVVYEDGGHDNEKSYTFPLKTASFNNNAHIAIRDARGDQVDYLPSSGGGGILVDYWIPSMFIESGRWTFTVDARLGDEGRTCLFAMSLTQWLEGRA